MKRSELSVTASGLTAVGRGTYRARGDDLYETPPVATLALLRTEQLPHYLWEPAAGRGAIVEVLRQAGHEVIASDLVDYGIPSHFPRRDFLLEYVAPERCQAIVTNPPFKLVGEFIAHGLNLVPLVIVLARLALLEGISRASILDTGKLSRVHVFRNRLPRMHRDGWDGPKTTNSIAFAWFVFDNGHNGPATLNRISWQ